MLSNERKVSVSKIIDFGITEKEMVFINFQTSEGPRKWFGGLTPKKPEKKMGARDVTFGTMTQLGWNGDIDAFSNGMPCFTLPEGVEVEIADDEYAEGKVSKDKVTKVFVPGYGASKLDSGKARSVLAGMMADINRAKSETAMKKDEPDF